MKEQFMRALMQLHRQLHKPKRIRIASADFAVDVNAVVALGVQEHDLVALRFQCEECISALERRIAQPAVFTRGGAFPLAVRTIGERHRIAGFGRVPGAGNNLRLDRIGVHRVTAGLADAVDHQGIAQHDCGGGAGGLRRLGSRCVRRAERQHGGKRSEKQSTGHRRCRTHGHSVRILADGVAALLSKR